MTDLNDTHTKRSSYIKAASLHGLEKKLKAMNSYLDTKLVLLDPRPCGIWSSCSHNSHQK